jgi:hypothetical protein
MRVSGRQVAVAWVAGCACEVLQTRSEAGRIHRVLPVSHLPLTRIEGDPPPRSGGTGRFIHACVKEAVNQQSGQLDDLHYRDMLYGA